MLHGSTSFATELTETLIDLLPDLIFVKDTEGRFLINNRAHALALGAATVEETIGKTDFDFYPPDIAQRYRDEESRLLQTGDVLQDSTSMIKTASGQTRCFQVTKVPLRDGDARVIGLMGIARDITTLKEAEEQLRRTCERQEDLVAQRTEDLARSNQLLRQQIEERDRIQAAFNRNHQMLRTLVDNLPDLIFVKDADSRFVLINQACATQLGISNPDDAIGRSDADFVTPDLAQRYRADELALMQSGGTVHKEEPTLHKDSGKMGCSLTTKLLLKDAKGNVTGVMGIARDITALKDAEKRLEAMHKELMGASRAAGMAEIAIGVLHNIGNVLNSVNVSGCLIQDRLHHGNLEGLNRLIKLLHEHEHDLTDFITKDKRGQQIPAYLDALALHLQGERDFVRGEVQNLMNKIEHIKEIVVAQQDYARAGGLIEKVAPAELVEDALKFNGAAFERHQISVVREFEPVPAVLVDKHKVLQILVNLLQNAKDACGAARRADKEITIAIKANGDAVKISVRDNGIGIPQENLQRVFTHGFTTRKDGHGFGLHSGTLAARELGGSLTVASDGPGLGATLTLELPVVPPSNGGKG